MKIKGKTILITGAGGGIGKSLVQSFIEKGAVKIKNILVSKASVGKRIRVRTEAKKDKEIGEDDAKRIQKELEDIVNSTKSEIEQTAKSKETEILTV